MFHISCWRVLKTAWTVSPLVRSSSSSLFVVSVDGSVHVYMMLLSWNITPPFTLPLQPPWSFLTKPSPLTFFRFEIDETSPSMSGCCGDDCSYEILSRRTKHGEASAGHTHGGGHCGGCCHWFDSSYTFSDWFKKPATFMAVCESLSCLLFCKHWVWTVISTAV